MSEVRLPPLPDEYDVMFQDSMKEMKEIVMKIRGKLQVASRGGSLDMNLICFLKKHHLFT
jgi:hypothetical protein